MIGDLVRLVHSHNSGALFGLFQDQALLFGLVSIGVVGLIVWYHGSSGRNTLLSVALGLLLGGALGNMLDRLRLGYVVDFVDAGIGDLRFYTFNVADSAITCAILLLLATAFLPGRFGLPPVDAPPATGRARGPGRCLTRPIAAGVRTVRVPDGRIGRIDRYVADVTGLSRSHVQKLITDGRLTADGIPLRANMIVPAGHGGPPRRAGAGRPGPRPGPRHPAHASCTRTPTCSSSTSRPGSSSTRRPVTTTATRWSTRCWRARAGRSTGASPGSRDRASSIASTGTRAGC